MGNEVHELLNSKPWPTNLTKDAMRRVYLSIAGYTRDVPDRWVYIRRDYRLETEEEPEPGEGNRVVKNAEGTSINDVRQFSMILDLPIMSDDFYLITSNF